MEAATECLRTHLGASKWFRVLGPDAVRKSLAEKQSDASSQCDTVECAAELGRVLGVQKAVIGSVARLGSTYHMILKLVNVKTGEVEKAAQDQESGDAGVLFALAQRVASQFLR